MKKFLIVKYDVSDLTDKELGELELEAVVQGEYSKSNTWAGTEGHPSVTVTSEVVTEP